MTKINFRIALYQFLISLCFVSFASSSFVEREVLVRYTEGATVAEIEVVELVYGLELIQHFDHITTYHYRFEDEIDVSEMVEILNLESFIGVAEPNQILELQNWTPPSDPRYSDQWFLSNRGQLVNGIRGRLGYDIAWEQAMNIYDPKGEIIVAVLDTGVAIDHPSFWDQQAEQTVLWLNPGEIRDGSDSNGNGFVDDLFGWDFYDDRHLPLDVNGHGSAVAGIIAANTNSGRGGAGIAPDAKIMSIRVGNYMGNVAEAAWIAGSTYAANNGAKILNLSFGGPVFNSISNDQIQWLDRQDILIVVAAGNNGQDSDLHPQYPASYEAINLLSVAAIDQNGDLAAFSNYRMESVHLAAPGVNMFGPGVRRENFYFEDFQNDAPDWMTGPMGDNQSTHTHWRLYSPLFSSRTWLTDSLSPLGFRTDYQANTHTYAMSPLLDLRQKINPVASFLVSYELEPSWDLFRTDIVYVEAGKPSTGWELVGLVYGQSAIGEDVFNPRTISVDLGRFSGKEVHVRLRFQSDHTLQYEGIYVTDFAVNDVQVFQYTGTQYTYINGTSFAAPVVAGIGALIWCHRPELSATDVALLLRLSAEINQFPSLKGRLIHDGSVDAEYALMLTDMYNPTFSRLIRESITVSESWYEHPLVGVYHLASSIWGDHAYFQGFGWGYVHHKDKDSFFIFSADQGWFWVPLDAGGWAYDMKEKTWVSPDL